MMSEPPKASHAQRMSFKTVSYLLGNFSQMASSMYKPKDKAPTEFQALKGSGIVTSINSIKVSKPRRYTDHFNEDQEPNTSIGSHEERPE